MVAFAAELREFPATVRSGMQRYAMVSSGSHTDNPLLSGNVRCSSRERTLSPLPRSAMMYGPAVRRKMMLAD